MIVSFSNQSGYGVQFVKFVTIGVMIISFHWVSRCKYPQSLWWFSIINAPPPQPPPPSFSFLFSLGERREKISVLSVNFVVGFVQCSYANQCLLVPFSW